MSQVMLVMQIVVSISLIGLILLQAKGVGLGRSFGSQAYHSRRGVEGLVFRTTIILSILFVVVSIANQFFV